MQHKVLFIAHDSLPYGPNQSLSNMISSLKANGVDVITVFPRRGVMCELFQAKGWDFRVINFRNELHPKLDTFLEYFKNILRRFYKYYMNKRALVALIKLIENEKISIIHSNSAVLSIGNDLSIKSGVKHVWHLREFIHPNYGLYVYGGLDKLKDKIRSCINTICITKEVAKAYDLKNNSLVLYDAIRKKPKFNAPQKREKYFLFCGSIHVNKGVEEAILVFEKFLAFQSDYRLLIVGEGEVNYEKSLKDKFRKLIDRKALQFLGFRKDVDDLMAKSSALLMCSRNEALGRVTIEAMLNYCIVIGYNDGGTMELISHNHTGLLYDTSDMLLKFLEDVSSNEGKYEGLRENAYKFATYNFLEQQYADKLIRYYKNLK